MGIRKINGNGKNTIKFVFKNVVYYTAERKKEFLPFVTAWIELKSIMLSEISQEVKDKYHMIAPISGT